MQFSRRGLLRSSSAITLGFAALRNIAGCAEAAAQELKPDPQKILDLPPGYTYRVISRVGQIMSDGLRTPGSPDGMAAFPGVNGKTIIIRNHELDSGQRSLGPFGKE